MKPDTDEALSNWERREADRKTKHRLMGYAIAATALFLAVLGLAVAR